MKKKIKLLNKNNFYILNKNIINQVFFVSSNYDLFKKVKLRGDKFRVYQYGDLFYFLAHIPPNKNTMIAVEEYAYYLIESLQNDNFVLHKNKLWSKENFYEHRFIDIKLFSLQFDKDNYLSS